MKRKIISVLLTLMLVASFSLVTAVPAVADPAEWYVNASVDASGAGTSLETAFRTIGEAVNVAGTGHTVNVAAGTYNEQVIIEYPASNISLVGAGRDSTTIDAGSTRWGAIDIQGASHITISGFTLRNRGEASQDYGINIVAYGFPVTAWSTYITVEDCTLDADEYGIRVHNYSVASHNIFRRNIITSDYSGTHLEYTSQNTVTQNTISSATGFAGINLMIAGDDNTIQYNEISGCKYGVNLVQSQGGPSGNIISNNEITNNERGIWWQGGPSNTVTENNIYDNTYNLYAGSYFIPEDPAPAENNWWGQDTPDAAKFYGEVDYTPWSTALNPIVPPPVEVWVDDDFDTNTLDWGITRFATIQEGINAVDPGGTVNVDEGLYNECLAINKSVSIVGAGVSDVTIDVSGLAGTNNASIYVSVDNVSLQGFTLSASSSPRYGIKFGAVSGGSVQHVLVKDIDKSGFDFLGTKNTTVSNIESRNNGGHGIQLCDCTEVALSDITVSGNGWEGVSVATLGRYTPLGTSGIVFSGTNSFVDVFQLEEGDYSKPNVAPSGEAIITYSTNLADGADVTVQASDFGYALHGDQDDGPWQNRVWFFKTLAEAQTAAPLAPGHFNGDGVYIESLIDRTQLYVSLGCEIQAAIDAASPNDTINVAAGTYSERQELGGTKYANGAAIIIDKSLTLLGANAGVPATDTRGLDESIITAPLDPLADFAVVITGMETVATFDGFTIDNYEVGGILAGSFSLLEADPLEVHILNNIVWAPSPIEDAHNNCIQVGDTTTGTIIGNEVFGAHLEHPDWSGSGILVAGSNDVLVKNNYAHGCDLGIAVAGYPTTTRPSAVDHIVEYNFVENCEAGISVQMNSIDTIVRYNDVSNNDVGIESAGHGSEVLDYTPSGTQIHYNNIIDNTLGVASIDWDDVGVQEEVDANYNWWGGIGGPGGVGLGNGDSVSAKVLYDPWLTETPAIAVTDGIAYFGSTIPLEPGWNTLSVPLKLKDSANTIAEIMDLGDFLTNGNVEIVYQYNSGSGWKNIGASTTEELVPLRGYYIKMKADSKFPVLYSGTLSFPTHKLSNGWNLIGSGFGIDKTDLGIAATNDEVDGQKDVATALYSIKDKCSVVVSPSTQGQVAAWGTTVIDSGRDMIVGKAYWVFMGGTPAPDLVGFEFTPIYYLP